MTKLEIIKELLVDTYANNPKLRAVNDMGNCRYTTEDGRHCAVGMCMTTEAEFKFIGFFGSLLSLIDIHEIDNHDSLLQEKYHLMALLLNVKNVIQKFIKVKTNIKILISLKNIKKNID